MGTNFYLHVPSPIGDGATPIGEDVIGIERTTTAVHAIERLHLGKRSAGWRFAFQAHPGRFTTFRELGGFLENTPGARIVDEYDHEHEIVEWCRMAATWGDGWPDGGHRQRDCWCGYGPDNPHGLGADPAYQRTHYRDEDGHDWTYREFF